MANESTYNPFESDVDDQAWYQSASAAQSSSTNPFNDFSRDTAGSSSPKNHDTTNNRSGLHRNSFVDVDLDQEAPKATAFGRPREPSIVSSFEPFSVDDTEALRQQSHGQKSKEKVRRAFSRLSSPLAAMAHAFTPSSVAASRSTSRASTAFDDAFGSGNNTPGHSTTHDDDDDLPAWARPRKTTPEKDPATTSNIMPVSKLDETQRMQTQYLKHLAFMRPVSLHWLCFLFALICLCGYGSHGSFRSFYSSILHLITCSMAVGPVDCQMPFVRLLLRFSVR
jgi:hypothetical protein